MLEDFKASCGSLMNSVSKAKSAPEGFEQKQKGGTNKALEIAAAIGNALVDNVVVLVASNCRPAWLRLSLLARCSSVHMKYDTKRR